MGCSGMPGAVAIAASLIGLVAAMLSYKGYKAMLSGGDFVCRPGSEERGCATVYAVPQAWFMGRWHFSTLAPIYFSIVTVASIACYLLNLSHAICLLAILTGIGLAMVPYLVYLELRVARAICIWCTIMHVMILVLTINTIYDIAIAS